MNRSDSRARLALTIVLVLIAVVFIQKTAKPYHMGRQARAEAQELAGQVEELKRQNEISEQRLEALQSKRGIEIEARKHHYIRPTEVPVQVAYDDGRSPDEQTEPSSIGEFDPDLP
ncbi:MAG: septum formation initiator family protein [Acidobacteriota bacterium]|nr:septum formation initiator family protein [Acidobacteriota bacterium]